VYLGGRTDEQRLLLPPVREAKSVADLRPLRLQFRFKGTNESREAPFAARIECRFEPVLADSYAKRIYLATLDVTGQWQTFDQSLAEGSNHEAFFQAIASENPQSFKIIWAHTGPIADYHPGDTLLIDDLVVTKAPASRA
jgi:hypothetical protein